MMKSKKILINFRKLMLVSTFFVGLNIVSAAQAFTFFGWGEKNNASNATNNAVVYHAANSGLDQQAKFYAAQNRGLRPEIVKLALAAYTNAVHQGVQVRKPFLTIIDYSLDSSTKRMWVLDLAQHRTLFNSLVAHGKYSGDFKYSTYFSDKMGSLQSSLGLFVTGGTYEGHDGHSMIMKGLERGFNANAEERRIVMHGAWYVNEQLAKTRGAVGRSWGCPALEPTLAVPVIDTIKDGSMIFSYYPNSEWLHKSRFIGDLARTA